MALSLAVQRKLEQDGFTHPARIYPEPVLDGACRRIAQLLTGEVVSPLEWQQEPATGGERRWGGPDISYRQIHRAWRDYVLGRALFHSCVGTALLPLLGRTVRLGVGTVFLKPAWYGAALGFHHHGGDDQAPVEGAPQPGAVMDRPGPGIASQRLPRCGAGLAPTHQHHRSG